MSHPVTIGPLLLELREKAHRSQAEQADVLSDLSGKPVTRNEVSRWENEGRIITPFWQRYYAASFDVPVKDLTRAVAATRQARRATNRPNHTLRAVREAMNMSLDEFAKAVRDAGDKLGEPNECGKHLVYRWESGAVRSCRSNYRRALQALTGKTYTELGFINPNATEHQDHAVSPSSVVVVSTLTADDGPSHDDLLTVSREESDLVASLICDQFDTDALGFAVEQLGIDYLSTPPRPMLKRAQRLRSGVIRGIADRADSRAITNDKDIIRVLGQLSGILAYAALDLGDVAGAASHARACWLSADRIGDNELRAWARGTQSLISRFDTNYDLALGQVRSGLRYATAGTSLARLRSGEAQTLANLGAAKDANAALDAAQDAHEHVRQSDSLKGIFTFTEAKQRYYASSSMIWLDGPENARRAVENATAAIEIWQNEPPETRSLDDEALAHVYLATALTQLDEIEGAMIALRPILDLPPERRISWITRRLARVADLFASKRYERSPIATHARQEIEAYGESTSK